MSIPRLSRQNLLRLAVTGLTLLAALPAWAQSPTLPEPLIYKVEGPNQRLEMIVNTSRILTLGEKIPQAQVNNPEVLQLTPLSATQIQVFARRPGVTTINLWDEKNNIHSVDVVVFGDARELKMILASQFPRASLEVTPLANSVIISGYIDHPHQAEMISLIARDYHPNIINNIMVGGAQQVLLDVRVMEVSRTKLRTCGIDLSHLSGNDFAISGISGLLSSVVDNSSGLTFASNGGHTLAFGIVDDTRGFFGVLEALRQNNLVKVLAEPKLVTYSGRPARFSSGGEFPILVPQSLGTVSIEFRPYGTEVDFVPIVMGNGNIRLEVRPRVSEIDSARSVTINSTTVPALTLREVDTGVEMRAGQTLAIAGLVQTRVETESKGLPWLSDLPWVGAVFRRNSSRQNEVETLILVTPQLVEAMDCHEVPPVGPGLNTDVPTDCELYMRGYIEVPKGYHERSAPHVHHGPVVHEPMHGPVMQGPIVHEHVVPGPAMQGPHGPVMQGPHGPVLGPAVVPGPGAGAEELNPPLPPSTAPPAADRPPVPPPPVLQAPAATPRVAPEENAAAPTAVRRAGPASPPPPARSDPPARRRRLDPPEPRLRDPGPQARAVPGFMGPTGYDVVK